MADIVFLTAPIGGGKSLFACRSICLELERSDRMIVTNVPLFIDHCPPGYMTVGEWCHEYVKHAVDLRKRLYMIPDSEVGTFPYHLPGFHLPSRDQMYNGSMEPLPDLELRMQMQHEGKLPNGCFYVLDEVHLFFSARQWSKTGKCIEFYRSQLRKLNDDLMLVTQHSEKVDKNFRRDSTEWIYLKNFSRQKLFAGVTLPGRFRYSSYPFQPMRTDSPTMSGWIQLEDRKYHKVYNTMAGVGITGKLMPEGSRVKGRHWITWLGVLLVVIVASYFIPRMLMRAGGHVIGSSLAGFRGGVTRAMSNSFPGVVSGAGEDLRVSPRRDLKAQGDIVVEKSIEWSRDVWVEGYERQGDKLHVYLSDGSDYWLGDGRFTRWVNQCALIDGWMYRTLSDRERLVLERRRFEGQPESPQKAVRR